jgi:hypothetical protein
MGRIALTPENQRQPSFRPDDTISVEARFCLKLYHSVMGTRPKIAVN